MLRWGGSVLIVVSTFMALEWLVAYHRQTMGAWRHSEMGRHLMSFMAAIAAVLVIASIRFFVVEILGHGVPTWFEALRLGTFISIPLVIGWRRWLLAKAQREES